MILQIKNSKETKPPHPIGSVKLVGLLNNISILEHHVLALMLKKINLSKNNAEFEKFKFNLSKNDIYRIEHLLFHKQLQKYFTDGLEK